MSNCQLISSVFQPGIGAKVLIGVANAAQHRINITDLGVSMTKTHKLTLYK